MHTLVAQMSIDPARAEEVARHLREDIVAWAMRQPGFVTGQWQRSPDADGDGRGRLRLRGCRHQGRAGPRSYPRDDWARNVEGITVCQQLTTV